MLCNSPKQSNQFSVKCDLGVEDVRDWAVLLGVAGHSREHSFVQIGHLGAQGQGRPTDAESLALWFKSDCGLGGELSRGIAAGLEPKRKRHGETTGVRGDD